MIFGSRAARGWCLLFLGGVLGILACSKSDPIEPGGPTGPSIRQVIGTTGWFPTVSPDSNAFAETRYDSTGADSEPLRCTDYEGFHVRELPVLSMLTADDGVQYPGAILQWESLGDAEPRSVVADRAGSTISLTSPSGGEVAGSIAAATGANVAAWRDDALDQLGSVAPGPWSMTAGIVYSEEHLAVLAGLDQTAVTAEMMARLVIAEAGQGRTFVRLQRNHHTITCPYPEDSRFAFASDVTGSDLVGQMALGNPPVWVDAVDYGQLLLVLVEADAEDNVVAEAVVNSFEAAIEGREPEPGAPLIHDLPDLTVSVMAVGADADAAEAAFADGQAQLATYLQASPGEPADLPAVTASLLALRNGGPITRGVEADIAFYRCTIHEPVLDQVLLAFEAADAHTELVMGEMGTDGEGQFEYDGSTTLYRAELIDFIPDLVGGGDSAIFRGRRPFLIRDALNGHPYVELYKLSFDDGTLVSELRYNGDPLVGRDYTIVLVCGKPRRIGVDFTTSTGGTGQISQVNQVNYFMHGTVNSARYNLKVGYLTGGAIEYTHSRYPVYVAVHDVEPDQFHVYVMTFDHEDGMALYFDGQLIGNNPVAIDDLLGYGGATLCGRVDESSDILPGVFWVAEMTAYLGAADAATVLEETRRLDTKYDLGLNLDP